MTQASNKFNTLSAIFRDASQVFFASMFVGPIISSNAVNWPLVLSGFFISYLGWLFSLFLTQN